MRKLTTRKLMLLVAMVAVICMGFSRNDTSGDHDWRWGITRQIPGGPSVMVLGFKRDDNGFVTFWVNRWAAPIW